MSDPPIKIEIVEGDVLTFEAEVLALKYAQHYYGSDAAVAQRLVQERITTEDKLQPPPGKWVWVQPFNAIRSQEVLFVGVPPLIRFGYANIADWARQVIAIASSDRRHVSHIAITLHGPGFGLDEIEALYAEVRGIYAAVQSGNAPLSLQRVSIVERKPARVERLQTALADLLAKGPVLPKLLHLAMSPSLKRRRRKLSVSDQHADAQLEQTAVLVDGKPRAFVAMPFAPEMEDVFYYGIQNPVRQLGYICERVDQEAFIGDILEQVKMRIQNAEIVIADLTGANANVYLEVGYAWGKGRRTVLVANKKDELRFDVRGQRCLRYQSIKDLEKQLTTELKALGGNSKD